MRTALVLFALALAMTACSHFDTVPNSNDSIHVALVFDDGPVPEQQDEFLSFLEKEGIKVSFAQVATTMINYPETSRAQLAAGHEIVNHSHDHHHPSELSDEELVHEIADAQTAMTKILGTAPRWYWPPYLEVDERGAAIAESAGIEYYYPPHNLVSSDDWDREVTAEQILERATTGVKDNTVILFHEWREETLEQLPAIIEELRRQNCVFMTFSELRAYAESL